MAASSLDEDLRTLLSADLNFATHDSGGAGFRKVALTVQAPMMAPVVQQPI